MDCTFSMRPTIPEEMMPYIKEASIQELVMLQYQLSKLPEDKPYLILVLKELRNREI